MLGIKARASGMLDVLHRRMTLLVLVCSAVGGGSYKVTLLLQNRQNVLLGLHQVSWVGDLCWPGDTPPPRMCHVISAWLTLGGAAHCPAGTEPFICFLSSG